MKLFLALFAVAATVVAAPLPKGWWAANSDQYRLGVDTTVLREGKPSAVIESIVPEPAGFIAFNQTFSAENYRGKRVRLAGYVKTQDVAKWSGFWLRADVCVDGLTSPRFYEISFRSSMSWLRRSGSQRKQATPSFQFVIFRFDDAMALDLVIRGVDVGVYANSYIPGVLKEWREPQHQAFEERNVWSLFNAFTETLKQANLTELPNRTEALHGLLDVAIGLN